jgi:hypothetical protein
MPGRIAEQVRVGAGLRVAGRIETQARNCRRAHARVRNITAARPAARRRKAEQNAGIIATSFPSP